MTTTRPARTIRGHKILRVSEEGAWIVRAGDHDNRGKTVSWETLHAAAGQDDPALRAVYADLLAEALYMARTKKVIVVSIANTARTPGCYEAVLRNVAGEHVSGRLVAADWGQRGGHGYALRDVDEAARHLGSRGYAVVRGYCGADF